MRTKEKNLNKRKVERIKVGRGYEGDGGSRREKGKRKMKEEENRRRTN